MDVRFCRADIKMTIVIEKKNIGHGEIRVTNDGGKITYEVDLPEGCPLSEQDIIPLCFRGKHLPEKTLLLETPYAYPLSHGEKFFDRIAVYDIDPKLMKKGVAITGKRELEEDAGNLVLVLKNIIGDPEKKRKFSNLLRDVLPFIEDFSVEKFMDISLVLTLREKYSKNHNLPSPSLSDGTLTIFALIIALYFEKKPVNHHRRTSKPHPPVSGCPGHFHDEGVLEKKAGNDYNPYHRSSKTCLFRASSSCITGFGRILCSFPPR